MFLQVNCYGQLPLQHRQQGISTGPYIRILWVQRGYKDLLTWFIRRIVPRVIAASTHTPRNKVRGFVHVLKKFYDIMGGISLTKTLLGGVGACRALFSLFLFGKTKFQIF